MKPATLQKLIWVLIYGGLLAGSMAFFVAEADGALATGLWLGGGAATVAGVAGIWWRSRMKG